MPLISIKTETIKNMFSSLRSRNYRLYFTGQGISLIGTWIQNLALSWLVYRLTDSVFLLGVVGFTSQIPSFILTPFTGVLTDRYNRLKIMIMAQILFMTHAFIMAFLVLTNLIEVWHIIGLSLVFGTITAFDAPARQSLVIDLIDKPEDLGNAIALNSALFNSGRLIGPAIAGIVIALVGEGICFLLNALSFVAVLAALMQIKIKYKISDAPSDDFKKSFKDGFQYTFGSVPIRTLILLLATLSLTAFPFTVLLPAYAKEILSGDADTLGFLMSALGAGALTGALYMAARKKLVGLPKIIAVNSSVLGISIIITALSGNLFFSLFFLIFCGLSMILALSSINTLIQTITDEDKRGRVMSFYAMALMGTQPIGNLLAGSIASGIGISYTLLLGGSITLIAGIWFSVNRRTLSGYIGPIYVKKGILPEL